MTIFISPTLFRRCARVRQRSRYAARRSDGNTLPTPVPLSVEEREKNLAMFRFIATETAARGLQFQLGIWTHAYEWTDSPPPITISKALRLKRTRHTAGMLWRSC